jgi:hypothetical protein
MLWFGFVSGHDFSQALKDGKRFGLQPLPWRIVDAMLAENQGLKPTSLLALERPD